MRSRPMRSGTSLPRRAAPGLAGALRGAGEALSVPQPLLPLPGASVLPGERRSFEVPQQWHGAIYPERPGEKRSGQAFHQVLVLPEIGPDAPGTICDIRGSSSAPGGPWTVTLLGLDVVRMTEGTPPARGLLAGIRRAIGLSPVGGDPWGASQMRLVSAALDPEGRPREEAPLPPGTADRLREAVLAVIRRDAETPVLAVRPRSHGEALAAIAATRHAEPLLDWALRHLDLPGAERLAIWRRPVRERLEALEPRLRDAAEGH